MASISANGSKGHHTFTLNVWENSVDASANTSNVGWNLVLSPIQTGWGWAISGVYWSVNVNGVDYSGSIPSYDGYSTVTIASSSLNVVHDNDGNKSIGFSFNINDARGASYTPGSCSASGSMWLTYTPRQASITSASNFNDEENPVINYSNPLGNNVADLQACIIDSADTIRFADYRPVNKTGNSYTFELTENERNTIRQYMSTSNSAIARYVLRTTIGTTNYWSNASKTMSIVNANPVFENFTYEDANTAVATVTGDNQVLVKGLSILKVTIPVADKMEALKEAIPKNYVVTIGTINQSANYDDEDDVVLSLGNVNTSGTQRLNVRAYDSRNNSTLVYNDVIVYDYAKPVVNFTAERLNNFEEQTTLKVNGSFSSLNINNVEKNTIQSVQYRYKEITSQTWSSWNNITYTIVDNNFTCNDMTIALDNTKEFNIEVKVTDNLSNNNATAIIDAGKSIFFISSNERKCYVNDKKILVEGDCKILSTEEKIIGVYNNKPLYAKTFFFSENHTANSSTVETNHLHNIADVDKIFIDQGSSFAESGGNSYTLGRTYINNNTVAFSMSTTVNSNNIRTEIYYGTNITLDFTITLNYTKTTD